MATILRPSRALFRFSGAGCAEAAVRRGDRAARGRGRAAGLVGAAVAAGQDPGRGAERLADDAFWLDVDRSVADAFLKRMKMYRLRAAVEIDDLRETHVVGWTDAASAGSGARRSARERVAVRRRALERPAGRRAPFDAARIARGVAELGPDFAADTTVSARYRHGPAGRRRLQEGLLHRPGGGEPDAASRHGAAAAGDRLRAAGWRRRQAPLLVGGREVGDDRHAGRRQGGGDRPARPVRWRRRSRWAGSR